MRSTIFIFLLLPILGFGQSTLSTKSKKAADLYFQADNFYVRRQYPQALNLLDEAIKKDKNFVEAYIKKGVIYKKQNKLQAAKESLELADKLSVKVRHFYGLDFELGELYILLETYDKAEVYLNSYLDSNFAKGSKKTAANHMLDNIAFAKNAIATKEAFNPRPLGPTINQFAMQYFPVMTIDNQSIIYTRRLGRRPENDEDLVIATKNTEGEWQAPVSLSDSINSQFNEGTATLSADGRLIIFTSCYGRKGYGSCDLYYAVKTGKHWSSPKNLGAKVNAASWDSQPSLSADGNTLYFVSDRSGGRGASDIWVTTRDENEEWTKPVNMGLQINSARREYSPFIHANGTTLYFSSDGQPGFGGFDLYYSEWKEGRWSKPKNMGAPLNTGKDQLSLFITGDGLKGYYSHEATNNTVTIKSELYEFDVPPAMQVGHKVNYVRGIVTDIKTQAYLNASLELINLDTDEIIGKVQSDPVNGSYLMVLPEGANYGLYIQKKGYLFKSLNFNYSQVDQFDPIYLDVQLEKVESGNSTVLNNVFFDHDEYTLKPNSKAELKKVVRFLKNNPSIKITVGGHTDSVGAKEYNYNLSKKRASAVVQFIVENGISAARIKAKGYGPDKPIASNASESGRKINRRIDFTVQDF